MKRINGIFLTLALLMVVQGIKAESYTGTLERHGAKIEYSFSGECKVTDKSKAMYGGMYPTIVGTVIDGEVKAGSALNVSLKKLMGSEKWKTLKIAITVGTINNNFVNYDKIESDNGVASKSITVPDEVVTDDGEKVKVKSIHISYYYRTLVSGASCDVNLQVVREVGAKETYRGKSEVGIAFEEPEGYCNYTITGRNFRKINDNSTELEADYYVGETVTVTCDGDADGAPYESYISYGNDEVRKLKGGVEKTFTIRKPNEDQADYISIGCCMAGLSNMDGTMSFQVCGGPQVRINIIDPNTEQPVATGNWEWNEVSPDERCGGCHGQWANYYIHTETAFDSNNEPYYGDPAMVCMSRTRQNVPDQNIFEYYLSFFDNDRPDPNNEWTKLENGYYNDFFYNNIISTRRGGRVILDHGDEEGSLTIEPRSVAHLVKRNADGSDRWNVYMGRIIGKHLKHVDKEPLFETSNIQARPTGTVFVLEADGKTSRVYLLSGSMDVASKKTKKKVTLKPGQASTTDANGQMKVQKFDIKKAARKFGITDDELQGTASTSTKRYEVERGLVKYKLTKGSEEGVMAKLFDSYGQMERRELKMPSQQTVQITQGNTSYRLNTQQKTAQGVKDAELNFLDFSIPIMKKLNLKKTGTGKVLDRQCDIYTNATMEYYVWKGIVLRKVEHTGNSVTTTEATSIEQPATVDGSLFKIPNGYTLKK